ncbi:MAG TPA: aspartyl protease family protein [Candidatus Acidoferrum sp.]|nr:aspartyl protease family protein [Candidatus Acidoferrum sp.]
MLRRAGVTAIAFLLLGLCLPGLAAAQDGIAAENVPIERCDLLPVVKIRIDGADMRFLLDTGATTMLNVKSFSSGRSKEIQVTSWSGTAATSAREVFLPELAFGTHRLRDLKLPAIDLSPIGKACGNQIDGILGVDLLDKMGVTIDLKRRVASLGATAQPPDAKAVYDQMEMHMQHCSRAFETGQAAELEECFDPEIVLYTPNGEFRGRKEVMQYLTARYMKYAPDLCYKMTLRDAKMFGEALWYSYDYSIDSPKEHSTGHGMSMCRRNNGEWQILNLHNSHVEAALQNKAAEAKTP